MKILYIYPHPDDESFGPAHVMHKQIRDGHEVLFVDADKRRCYQTAVQIR